VPDVLQLEQQAQGTLPPWRNEVVQLGFRLGQLSGVKVAGIDEGGDFPFGAVQAWADAHGVLRSRLKLVEPNAFLPR
jgi:hypothetical protein